MHPTVSLPSCRITFLTRLLSFSISPSSCDVLSPLSHGCVTTRPAQLFLRRPPGPLLTFQLCDSMSTSLVFLYLISLWHRGPLSVCLSLASMTSQCPDSLCSWLCPYTVLCGVLSRFCPFPRQSTQHAALDHLPLPRLCTGRLSFRGAA